MQPAGTRIRVNRVVRTHRAGQLEATVVHVGRDDARRTGRLADANGKDPDRTATGYQHNRPRNLSGERRVKRVAHRVVDPANVERNTVVQMPDIERRHRDVFREAAVAVDANDPSIRAHV